ILLLGATGRRWAEVAALVYRALGDHGTGAPAGWTGDGGLFTYCAHDGYPDQGVTARAQRRARGRPQGGRRLGRGGAGPGGGRGGLRPALAGGSPGPAPGGGAARRGPGRRLGAGGRDHRALPAVPPPGERLPGRGGPPAPG